MICTLTARLLRPGSYDDFRKAWGGDGHEVPEGAEKWNLIYHCRDVNDENVVVSFGMFQGGIDELRQAQKDMAYEGEVSKVDPYVDEVLLDGAYEVVEEITPQPRSNMQGRSYS
jgi:hypothetical protein